MRGFLLRLIILLALTYSATSYAVEPFPWNFDMTPEEVKAVTAYGPYHSFSNGDLETYIGIYDGREENVQFFFADGKLRRIGVYFYEGKDIKLAAVKWLFLYESLLKRYGVIETPNNNPPNPSDIDSRSEFAARAANVAFAPGKIQMAPDKNPADASVFASFWGNDLDGERTYYVVLYYDKRL